MEELGREGAPLVHQRGGGCGCAKAVGCSYTEENRRLAAAALCTSRDRSCRGEANDQESGCLPGRCAIRDGQTGRPAWLRPGEAWPILGLARQTRLENRAGPV
jgi:hypothetical protein